jgi:RHS repeat-associated protein
VRVDGTIKERIYLGAYEIYRERSADTIGLERRTLHLNDEKRRLALVESLTVGTPATSNKINDGPARLIRHQLDNHIGSAALELDGDGTIVSYEEYHPYGTTAYRATAGILEKNPKRYAFTAKERDEETGLSYHGARYLASWLGRWMSTDPRSFVDGTNVYAYVRANAIRLVDPNGTDSRQDALNYRVELMKEGATKLAGTRGGKHLKGFGVPFPIQEVEGERKTVEGRFDPEFWEPRAELDPKSKVGMLRLKEGKSPSKAIRAIVEHPDKWYLDCATFLQVTTMLYARVQETADDEKFDHELRAEGKNVGGIFLRSHKSTGLNFSREWSFEGVSNKLVGSSTGNKALSSREMSKHIESAPVGSEFVFQNVKTSDQFSFHLENTILVGKTKSGERQFLAWGLEPVGETKHVVFTEAEVRRGLAAAAARKLGGSFDPLKDIRVKTLGYFPSP